MLLANTVVRALGVVKGRVRLVGPSSVGRCIVASTEQITNKPQHKQSIHPSVHPSINHPIRPTYRRYLSSHVDLHRYHHRFHYHQRSFSFSLSLSPPRSSGALCHVAHVVVDWGYSAAAIVRCDRDFSFQRYMHFREGMGG